MKSLLTSLLTVILFSSCSVDPPILSLVQPPVLGEIIPEGWPQPVYTFSANPVTPQKFELGRSLFYEPLLSRDNTISCGSCHQQFAAFANAEHRVSHGVDDQDGTRNSPALFNLTWHPGLMHDGGVNHLELQPLAPIANPVEMDENIGNVLTKLSGSEKYRRLFREAFGTEEITSDRLLKAMAQFMGLMYSYNSKFDQFKRRENNVTLSENEARGYALFLQKCNGCHTEPLFSDFKYRSNGLSVDPALHDSGRAVITALQTDLYRFKTPSLRNIVKSPPYMHDGRYNTLEECLDHYSQSITNHTNLDPLLEYGIPMTPKEKTEIIAFLHTLTDYTFLNDKRFSEQGQP